MDHLLAKLADSIICKVNFIQFLCPSVGISVDRFTQVTFHNDVLSHVIPVARILVIVWLGIHFFPVRSNVVRQEKRTTSCPIPP